MNKITASLEYRNKEFLLDQYITQDKSVNQIIKELNVCDVTIYKWLARFGIQKKQRLAFIGERFGRLVVLERAPNKGRAFFLCRCDCGTKKIIESRNLRSGTTKSCGCISKFPPGEAAFKLLFRNYKIMARTRNIKFELSEEEFRKFTKKRCYYCGIEPRQKIFRSDNNGGYLYNGIDRKDNNIGYLLENCVPCCGECNKMKRNLSVEDFISHVTKIANFFNLGESNNVTS